MYSLATEEPAGWGALYELREDIPACYHCGEKIAKLILFHFELIFAS